MAHVDLKDTVPIPQPPGYPIIGNVSDIDLQDLPTSLLRLSREYGEVYSLTLFGQRRVVVNSVALTAEICDERRFEKLIGPTMTSLRSGLGNGLITAPTDDKWEHAHRVLVPAFGPFALKDMFGEMKDIASQMVLKFARMGSDYQIPIADELTKLTLDTLALCAMSCRFNSFYSGDQNHPFIDATTKFLRIAGNRIKRPGFLAPFFRTEDATFEQSIAYMRNLSADLVKQRRESPDEDKKDLLHALLKGTDPKTGQGLDEEEIIDNMITFLVAGHETTSGLLAFLWFYMLDSPEAYETARKEVDSVLGNRSIQFEDLRKLRYCNAMVRETLRLQPTAPTFALNSKSATECIGGKYGIKQSDVVMIALHAVHRDPAVYGEDAEEWKPERMLDENFDKLPPHAWKAFGNGARGCIGRTFVHQEALVTIALLLQSFDFRKDPDYELRIQSNISIKPKDFSVHANLRNGLTPSRVEQMLAGKADQSDMGLDPSQAVDEVAKHDATLVPFTILYGSNSGTCEALARKLAVDAPSNGFRTSKVDSLDSLISSGNGNPCFGDEPVIIITASYDGQPPQNATKFYSWLSGLSAPHELQFPHAVFGAGHSDWKDTFFRIPTAVDDQLTAHGSRRMCNRGSANASEGDMINDFQRWEDHVLWPAMRKHFHMSEQSQVSQSSPPPSPSIRLDTSSDRPSHLRMNVSEAKVTSSRSWKAPGLREKRHIELELPTSIPPHRAGDYLAVLPLNPEQTVRRVFNRFGLSRDSAIVVRADNTSASTNLPTDTPISAHLLFSAYLELGYPASRPDISMLISCVQGDETKSALENLEANFAAEVTSKRVSLLDLLERSPETKIALSTFVASLPTMKARQYSISSSPIHYPKVSLTYEVIDEPSLSNHHHHHHHQHQHRFVGVAGHHMSQLQPGDALQVAVWPSHESFHLPASDDVPIVMVAVGTGIAPFRGFLQERRYALASGDRQLAPAVLYFGCRHPEKDLLYGDELRQMREEGAAEVRLVFSQASPEVGEGVRHGRVNDALEADFDSLRGLWKQGASLYVCGSKRVADSVERTVLDGFRRNAREKGKDDSVERAKVWLDGIRGERYMVDAFG